MKNIFIILLALSGVSFGARNVSVGNGYYVDFTGDSAAQVEATLRSNPIISHLSFGSNVNRPDLMALSLAGNSSIPTIPLASYTGPALPPNHFPIGGSIFHLTPWGGTNVGFGRLTYVGPLPVLTATYSLSRDKYTIYETHSTTANRQVNFTLRTTNVPNGRTLYWRMVPRSGSFTANDVTHSSTNGSFTVSSNRATVRITGRNDGIYDPNERFRLDVFSNSARTTRVASSSDVTIRDDLEPLMGKLTLPKQVIEGKNPHLRNIPIQINFNTPGSGGIIRYE